MSKAKKRNMDHAVSRKVSAYPSGYLRNLTEAYASYMGETVSRVVCDALKASFEKLSLAERDRILKAHGGQKTGKAARTKNSY